MRCSRFCSSTSKRPSCPAASSGRRIPSRSGTIAVPSIRPSSTTGRTGVTAIASRSAATSPSVLADKHHDSFFSLLWYLAHLPAAAGIGCVGLTSTEGRCVVALLRLAFPAPLALAPFLHETHERGERRRRLMAAWIIQERSGKRRTPVL